MVRGIPVSIRCINKAFDATSVLHDVSIEIGAGEFVTLLGPSGSGKTTLLMIISGFLLPSSGDMLFDGRSVIRLPPHRRNIGMVFQNYALFPHLTVAENIAFPLRIRRVPEREIARKVKDVLELVQLGGFGDRRITQLSGGQGQRVALARAIVFEPDILLMDEPLSALDKKLREQMQVELRRLHEELGFTTIYVTHDQREALTMSDRVAVLNGGRVEQFGDPRSIYDRPATAFVADFVGESAIVEVQRRDGAVLLGETRLQSAHPLPESVRLMLLLRPEKLRILSEGEIDGAANRLRGRVLREAFHGETVFYEVLLESGQQIGLRDLARRSGSRPVPGQTVDLALHFEDTVFVGGGATCLT